jgi:hypothetical protein
MAAVWVQKNARWDGFPSSQFRQINSPKRKTLGTSFSLFKLPLNFSDRRRKSKRSIPGKNQGEQPPGPHWASRTGLAGPPCSGEKVGPINLREKLQKIKEKLFTKIHTLFYVLGWTFGLFFHSDDINMVKGTTSGL